MHYISVFIFNKSKDLQTRKKPYKNTLVHKSFNIWNSFLVFGKQFALVW